MNVNNTILFPQNVDQKNRAGGNSGVENTQQPAIDKTSIQPPTDETKIPSIQELNFKSQQAQDLANQGKVLDRGSFVNFVV